MHTYKPLVGGDDDDGHANVVALLMEQLTVESADICVVLQFEHDIFTRGCHQGKPHFELLIRAV